MINPSEGSPGYIQVISLVRQSRNISKLLEVCLPQIWWHFGINRYFSLVDMNAVI